jgi:hypothetical protein
MEHIELANTPEARHVDVLTSPESGVVVGYRVQGGRPGPHLLVGGFSPNADVIFDRFLDLPTLPWLSGSVSLLIVDALDESGCFETAASGPWSKIDEILFLPFAGEEPEDKLAQRNSYWSILRACAKLGMIDGRGVTRLI